MSLNPRFGRRHLLVLQGLAMFVLHAGLTRGPGGATAVTVRGLGATFPYRVYAKWQADYAVYRRRNKDVTITYEKTGSGTGRERIIQHPREWDFAGTDVPLSQKEMQQVPDLVIFPTLAGGVAIAYHLPMCKSEGGKRLNLSMEHVVGIFNGTITNWNDGAFKPLNQNCEFPDEKIRVVARAQKSGTTSTFTSALSAADSNWEAAFGDFSEGMNTKTYEPYKWKSGVIAYFGPKNEDVASLILSVRFTLGYISAGDVQEDMSVAGLVNKHGEVVTVNKYSLQAAMDSKRNASSLTVDLLNPDTRGAYPIASYTYLIFYGTQMRDCAVATELMRYILWFMNQTAGAGFATLSENMAARVTFEVLTKVTCRGRSVLELVEEQIAEENRTEERWLIPVAVTVPIFLVVVGSMLGYILWQRIKLDKMINMDDWNIPIEEIIFFYDEKMQVNSQGKSKLLRQKSVKSLKSIGEISEGSELLSQILQWPGRWRANIVGIRLLDVVELKQLSRQMKKTMLWMRDSLINANVVRFYGLTDLHDGRYVIEDFCSKGTVLDVLQNGRYNLTTDFKMSVALEIACGMAHLHVNNVVHGMLRSTCCWLDNKWTVKIGDWEYCKLLSVQNPKTSPLQVLRSKGATGDKYELLFRDFWTAPELLRSDLEDWPSQASDVYSFAIILQELFTRDEPYFELAEHLTPDQVLHSRQSGFLQRF
ncbi:hypothetical protein RRG08_029671 [Elysia crispata]|uniref:Protein kinase domain-containing protein n=1 Tax=Elysia crispata TaxID=231223 RepID=A0AAE1EFR2_9GAST|nr:hypothetical protein RRG08_029671 [Elysia crispata]